LQWQRLSSPSVHAIQFCRSARLNAKAVEENNIYVWSCGRMS
jgi:hypothetical protein